MASYITENATSSFLHIERLTLFTVNITNGSVEGNFTINLEEILGPKQAGLRAALPITLVYILIFITGVFGNICTCIIIFKNRYMHTPTNYYLFNLAVSDLLMLVLGLPQEIYTLWSAYPYILGETICRLRLLAAEASTYTSILTITAFTVERYNAICYPMRVNNSNLSRVLRVIISIWCLSIMCAIPVAIQFGIIYVMSEDNLPIMESAQCNTHNEAASKIVFQVSTFLFFMFPMAVIGILYFMIALAIRRSVLIRSGSDSSNESQTVSASATAINPDTRGHQSQIRQSVLKMLVAVVVAFFLCWAPFHAQRLLVVYVEHWTLTLIQVHEYLYYISGVLYYINSTINPILYSIMSVKFRQAFRSTILFPCCQTNRRKSRCSYTYKFSHQKNSDTNCTAVDSSPPSRCCVPARAHTCEHCRMERIPWKGTV